MHQHDPLRTEHRDPAHEAACPYCGDAMQFPTPEALVSLTACPHPSCQRVALVCTGAAAGRGCESSLSVMDAETYARATTRPITRAELWGVLGWFGAFVVWPALLGYEAVTGDYAEFTGWLIASTVPALILGVTGLLAIVADCVGSIHDRAFVRAVRREAFANARWLRAA